MKYNTKNLTPEDVKKIIDETEIPDSDQLYSSILMDIMKKLNSKDNWFDVVCGVYTLGYHFGKASKKR